MNSDMNFEYSKKLCASISDNALVEEYEIVSKLFNSDLLGDFAFTDYYFDIMDYLSDEICKRYIEIFK